MRLSLGIMTGLVIIGLALGREVAAQTPAATGKIAGRVLDGGTGKPLQGVTVEVAGQTGKVETDLDGRFRTASLPPGIYSVTGRQLGFKPAKVDSVRVTAGQTTVINVALNAATVQLEELAVAAEVPEAASSDAGLLSEQKNAAVESDGVSAEFISKTPDSDAGAAITRVSGVAVLADKVVIRGLTERYSTSVLNGIEVASPEPDKQLVPLNAFPSSLLEALVVQKTATPDRPGDFAGGSADIRTKEFPEETEFAFQLKGGYNSNGTFEDIPFPDWRGAGATPPPNPDPAVFSQGFANVWTPASSTALPAASLQASFGTSFDIGQSDVFGFSVAVNTAAARTYVPDLYSTLGSGAYTYNVASAVADFGGIANFSYRLGSRNKLSFKNFYTTGSTSTSTLGSGVRIDPNDAAIKLYQMFFIERFIYQGLIEGEHLLPNGRLEWRAGYGRAGRSDNDNRQLTYVSLAGGPGFQLLDQFPNFRYNYDFTDVTTQGDFSYATPFTLREEGDAEFKVGALGRFTNRQLDGAAYQMVTGGAPLSTRLLPPEQAFAPENMGSSSDGLIQIVPTSGIIFPYSGTDDVFAAFVMADMEAFPRLRFVGGLRMEQWNATVRLADTTDAGSVPSKASTDWLPSVNLTYAVSPSSNLRAAFSQTVVRPELREFAPGGYPPVVGGLFEIGNPALEPGTILNYDLRFETYPSAGEQLSASLFYKQFDNPIVTVVQYQSGEFVSLPVNAVRGSTIGIELEAQKSLGFISHALRGLLLQANLTLLRSRITLPDSLGVFSPDLQFQGQSPYLINVDFIYQAERPNVTASLLFNYFGNRVFRYGALSGQTQGPNYIEVGHETLDAKVVFGLSKHWQLSIDGKNLTNALVLLETDDENAADAQRIAGSVRYGVDLNVAVNYAF